MNMIRILGFLFLFFGLTACASNTVQQDFSFGDDPNEALLVIRKLPDVHETRINVRQADLDLQEFAPGAAKAVYLGRGTTPRNQAMLLLGGPLLAAMASAPGNVLDEHFFLLTVPAGDYSVVSHVTEKLTPGSNSAQPGTRTTTTFCYSEGAPVYRLNGGEINLINLNDAESELTAQILENAPEDVSSVEELKESAQGLTIQDPEDLLRSVLADFPNIKGEVRTAQRIAKITFDGERSFLRGSDCPKGVSISSVELIDENAEKIQEIEE